MRTSTRHRARVGAGRRRRRSAATAGRQASNACATSTGRCRERRAETGGGGRHLYCAYPGALVHNRVGILPASTCAPTAVGVVAPPSRHPADAATVAEGSSPDDLPLAALPAWLLPARTSTATRPSPAHWRDWLRGDVAEGRRNNTAGLARRPPALAWVRPAVVLELLHAFNRVRSRPPLPRRRGRAGGGEAPRGCTSAAATSEPSVHRQAARFTTMLEGKADDARRPGERTAGGAFSPGPGAGVDAVHGSALLPNARPSLTTDAFTSCSYRRQRGAESGGNVRFCRRSGTGLPAVLLYQHLPHLAIVLLDRLTAGGVGLMTCFNAVRYLLWSAFRSPVYCRSAARLRRARRGAGLSAVAAFLRQFQLRFDTTAMSGAAWACTRSCGPCIVARVAGRCSRPARRGRGLLARSWRCRRWSVASRLRVH